MAGLLRLVRSGPATVPRTTLLRPGRWRIWDSHKRKAPLKLDAKSS